jgi:DNA-binding beta-propeller fold protein YncE
VQVFDARGNLIDVWDAIMKSKTREFSQPEGIATDGKLIYVADSGNNRILLFDPRGDLLYEFGYYGPKGGQFSNPTSLAVSGMNVFVADTGNDRIQSFTNDGSGHFRFLNEWGRTGTGAGEFKSPRGIALIAGGQAVLVSDSGNNRIQMFDPKGRYLREFGGQGQAFGLFLNPAGMAVDAKGNITVADAGNNRIQVLAEKGYFLTSWGNFGKESGAFAFPRDAAVDGNGNIFVADTLNHRIQAFDSAGIFLREWGVYGINKGEFDSPAGIAVDEKGLVFVSDTLNNRIQAFTGDGKFVTVWGSLGTGKGQFSEPRGIATDSRGAVYVADALNHRIQVLDRQGAFVNFLGHKGSGDGELIYPSDVTVDETGNVYVADSGNNRVQVFDAKGNYISQWGKPGPAGNQFDNPTGIALDGNGRLVYVTDANNHRVQVFDKAGQFVTDWGSPGTGSGQFAFPAGVAVSACNTVYVADSANGRIEAFEGLGTKGEIVANAGPDQTIEQASVNGALVTLDGSASTESCGSSLTYEWSWAGGSASGPAPAVYLPAGRTTITLTARNGILFATDTVDVTIADTQKPSSAAAVSGTAGTNGWYSSGVKVALSATDAGSGMKEIRYHVNGGAETIVPGNAALIDLVSDGAYTVAYYSVDNADNREDPREIFVKIDAIAPVITSVVAPAPNAAGWNKEDVVVSFLCSDARSGVANCSAPVTIGSEVKDQVIAGSASDNAGNSASTSVTVNVDKTAPAIIVSGIQNGATYEFGLVPAAGYTVSDAYSGVATSSGTLGGGDGMGLGAFTYSVTASDNAGNSATVTTAYTVIATPTGTIAVVDQLVDTGAVTGAEAAILTDMLTAALAAPNTQSQANKLNAMINHINAKTGKDITADAAAILINAANHIIKH